MMRHIPIEELNRRYWNNEITIEQWKEEAARTWRTCGGEPASAAIPKATHPRTRWIVTRAAISIAVLMADVFNAIGEWIEEFAHEVAERRRNRG